MSQFPTIKRNAESVHCMTRADPPALFEKSLLIKHLISGHEDGHSQVTSFA